MKQDNPFAKGVSINQDIVMEEGIGYNTANPVSVAIAQIFYERTVRMAFECATGFSERQLLALGREEE